MRIVILMFLLVLPFASATELGVNLYHESMMGSWGGAYIPRSSSQIDSDITNIKTITNNIKFFMNPFIDGNLQWVQTLAAKAEAKGMHTVVTMMVDDRQLDNSNWWTYHYKVKGACQALNGKVDEILVGNEITLHSPLPRTDIKYRVVHLMNECKTVYNGAVSYQEFWYAKDVWTDYTGKLYFMFYEDRASFDSNVKEMRTKFPNAVIGEWGEDLYDGSINKGETWQGNEISYRWSTIKSTGVPIAYIFAYKEPSYTGFGIVRSDDSKRLAWYVLGSNTEPVAQPAPTPNTQTSTTQYITSLPSSCASYTLGGTEAKICNKGSNTYEIYLIKYGGTNVCYKTYCVGSMGGFVKFTTTTTAPTTTTQPTTTTNKYYITSLPAGGTCKDYWFNTSKAKVCEKGGYYEMYRVISNQVDDICYKTYCVGKSGGFARFYG